MIFALALIRTVEHSPFKRMEHFYNHSFISELLTKVNLSPKHISLFLQQLGAQRKEITRFMQSYAYGSKHILIGSSAITSKLIKVLRTNLDMPAAEVYAIYKERGEIEQSFDFLKNLMEQDKTYMQNESSLEARAFINHISLMLHYRVYRLLRNKKLLKKYSVGDFFAHLKYIFKINSGGEWITSEISQKTKKLLDELKLHIT